MISASSALCYYVWPPRAIEVTPDRVRFVAADDFFWCSLLREPWMSEAAAIEALSPIARTILMSMYVREILGWPLGIAP